MMTIGRDHLSKDDAVTIATIEAAVPTLVTARGLAARASYLAPASGTCGEVCDELATAL
jgi:hypothetical protein